MKNNILISVLITVFSLFSIVSFSQTRSGNYINRDSTSVTNPFQFTTIVGPSAGKNIALLDGNLLQYTSNITLIGSSSGNSLGTLNTDGSKNFAANYTMIGAFAGYNKKRAIFNDYFNFAGDTYIGAFAGYLGENGGGNTLIGYKAGYALDSTHSTVAIGNESGSNAKLAYNSVFIGTRSGKITRGQGNVAIGGETGNSISSSGNVLLGSNAGGYSTIKGGGNVLIGYSAGAQSTCEVGGQNVMIGQESGFVNSGGFNTFLGSGTGQYNTFGYNNTFLGSFSGRNIKTGNNNTFIGSSSGVSQADSNIYNSVAIGSYARVSASNSFILGDVQTKVGIGNTAPQNKLEITSATTNTSGLRFTNLKSTSTPSTANSLSLSVDVNGDVILVPAATGGLTNPVTNLQVLSGTAGVSGLRLNNLPLTTTAAAANGKTLSVDATGNVILVTAPAGFTNPVTNLQVQSGTAGVSGLTLNNVNSASATTTANGKVLSVDATGNVILVPSTAGVLPAGADVWDQLTNGADYLIRNKNNKSVMIGVVAATKTNADYKLYVEKGILAEKVKVSAQANWPDYVFGKDYSLMPLKEVENYITTNNHLPEVPSAEVIAKDGLDLGKMDATLLKKVEELTLYLIEQNKKIEVLQNELNILKAKK